MARGCPREDQNGTHGPLVTFWCPRGHPRAISCRMPPSRLQQRLAIVHTVLVHVNTRINIVQFLEERVVVDRFALRSHAILVPH
jgi:hypothetical protein